MKRDNSRRNPLVYKEVEIPHELELPRKDDKKPMESKIIYAKKKKK